MGSMDDFLRRYESEVKNTACAAQPPQPPAPDVKVPITADVHARRVIRRLAERCGEQTEMFVVRLTALNHYSKQLAEHLKRDPKMKTYEDIARAHRWMEEGYSRSAVKFNARGLAVARAQQVVDYFIEHLHEREAVFEFLEAFFECTHQQLMMTMAQLKPRYEDNLRILCQALGAKVRAEVRERGWDLCQSGLEEMLGRPLFSSVNALAEWDRPTRHLLVPQRSTYLEEIEAFWSFFDARNMLHVSKFAHAWSYMAGRKVQLQYGEGEKKYYYPIPDDSWP